MRLEGRFVAVAVATSSLIGSGCMGDPGTGATVHNGCGAAMTISLSSDDEGADPLDTISVKAGAPGKVGTITPRDGNLVLRVSDGTGERVVSVALKRNSSPDISLATDTCRYLEDEGVEQCTPSLTVTSGSGTVICE